MKYSQSTEKNDLIVFFDVSIMHAVIIKTKIKDNKSDKLILHYTSNHLAIVLRQKKSFMRKVSSLETKPFIILLLWLCFISYTYVSFFIFHFFKGLFHSIFFNTYFCVKDYLPLIRHSISFRELLFITVTGWQTDFRRLL